MISAVALIVVFWGVKPERILDVLSNAKYVYLVPIEAVLIAGLIARSNSWRLLLSWGLSLRKVFDVVNVGYLINTVMPFRLGELGRAQIVSSGEKISIARVLGTIMIERLLDTLISFSALLISLPMIIIPNWAENLTWVVGISVFGVLATSFILLYKRENVLALVERFSRIGLGRLRVITGDFISGLESLLQPTRILRAGFWSLLAWICVWLQMWLLLTALDAPTSLAVFIFVPSVVAFGSALPPSPGALGVFEIAAVAGLLVFGYERETALSVAILWHGLQLITTAVLGGWGLSREGHSILEIAEKAQALLRNRKVNSVA
jgi:uncharacterized protein (TIRG00374 family)